MKPIRTTNEMLALCNVERAKRTDPTPAQVRQAREHWRAEPLLVRIAHLFKREVTR